MTVVLPTLSPSGWVKSPEEKAYFAFAHLYEAQKNQSLLYGKNVSNMQWLAAQYGHDIPEFCAQLRLCLEKYLGRYFEAVSVNISHNDTPANPGSKVNVTISSEVWDNGKRYSFGHLVEMNGKIAKLLTLINGEYV